MPFTLDIIPHVPSLDMYGSAKTGSAYSLSGEVVLTLTSPAPSPSLGLLSSGASSSTAPSSSTFRPTTIYLSSLLITFEGKAELLSSHCPYAPFRLCQVEKELVGPANGGKPIVLTNRAQANGVMRWSMTFDLAIPGWLPPTIAIDEHSGASYTIHAHAKFADDLETAVNAVAPVTSTSPSSSNVSGSQAASRPGTPIPAVSSLTSYFTSIPSLPTLLNPFALAKSKLRSAYATPVAIKINRYRAPKSLNPFRGAPDFSAPLAAPQIYHPTPSFFPVSLESVETRVNLPAEGRQTEEDRAKRIPVEVLSNIEVVAGVPEYVGTTEGKIPLSLRIRLAPGSEMQDALVLDAFDVEVEQLEKFRSVACERYTSSWPVPSPSQQPPVKPLLTTNHIASLYSLSTLGGLADPVQWTRAVPMLPSRKVNFRPAPATGGLEIDGDWAKMDLAISVLRSSDKEEVPEEEDSKEDERVGRQMRRKLINPDFDTPFTKIRHEMKLALKLSWLPADVLASIKAKYAHMPHGPAAGEKLRKARAAHPARLSETLLVSLPIRLVQVSERVETIFRTMGFHHGSENLASVAMRRCMAQSRSASPALSAGSVSGRASPAIPPHVAAGALAIPSSAAMSRPCNTTPSASPAPSTSSLPALSSSSSSSSSRSSSSSSCDQVTSGMASYGAAPTAFPGDFMLPPYSELYYSNGDRKDSLGGGWLPKYTEKEDSPVLDTAPAPAVADPESEEESEEDIGLSSTGPAPILV